MNTCETCKHWGTPFVSRLPPYQTLASCNQPYPFGIQTEGSDEFWVASDFGCNRYVAKI